MCTYVYIYMRVYIYIKREREREICMPQRIFRLFWFQGLGFRLLQKGLGIRVPGFGVKRFKLRVWEK